jgi:hypothetical protein
VAMALFRDEEKNMFPKVDLMVVMEEKVVIFILLEITMIVVFLVSEIKNY